MPSPPANSMNNFALSFFAVSFFLIAITSGSSMLRNGRHLTVIRVKVSALHVAISHFYRNSY